MKWGECKNCGKVFNIPNGMSRCGFCGGPVRAYPKQKPLDKTDRKAGVTVK